MTNRLSSLQNVELFHLLFFDQLGRKLDKSLFALKGGCNLRFFLKSIRYSQDMDLDVHTIRKETLNNTVNSILKSSSFALILRAKQMEIAAVSKAKQTDTTQRWKIQIRIPHSSIPLHTKIEFSRRGAGEDVIFESVDPLMMGIYKLTPIYASHYSMHAAMVQKIWALILRTETQARDVFDLFHLLNMGIKLASMSKEMISRIKEAETHAMSISCESFKSQVVSYLPLEYHLQYSDPAFWDVMVLQVCQSLETFR